MLLLILSTMTIHSLVPRPTSNVPPISFRRGGEGSGNIAIPFLYRGVESLMNKRVITYRFCCHGNVRLNDDSTSQRSIPIALRVIINPVDGRGGQSARDDKSHTRTWQAECA